MLYGYDEDMPAPRSTPPVPTEDAMECPACKEIELRPADAPMYECSACGTEVQF